MLGLPSLKAEWADGEVEAVNDLAIFRGGESRIADLTYAVNGEVVATVRCDGVVMSTPVGSTAYNLAAGRPHGVVARALLRAVVHRPPPPRQPAAGDRRRGELTVTNSALVGDCDSRPTASGSASLGPGRSRHRAASGGSEVHLATFPEASFFRRYREKFGRP